MERLKIQVDSRDLKGKEAAKKLRDKGYLPAIVYSHELNVLISVPTASLKSIKAIHFSESVVIDMEIANGKKPKAIPVLIKDVQFHPLTEQAIHIDFLKVSLDEKIKVNVPIVLKGEAKSVTEEDGTIEQTLRDLEIEGLPLDVPESIEVDISELTIGHSLHVESIIVADNLKIITDPGVTIATAVAKKEEEVEEVVLTEEEAAAGEPEVIKEKKEASGEEAKEKEPGKEKEPEKGKKPE